MRFAPLLIVMFCVGLAITVYAISVRRYERTLAACHSASHLTVKIQKHLESIQKIQTEKNPFLQELAEIRIWEPRRQAFAAQIQGLREVSGDSHFSPEMRKLLEQSVPQDLFFQKWVSASSSGLFCETEGADRVPSQESEGWDALRAEARTTQVEWGRDLQTYCSSEAHLRRLRSLENVFVKGCPEGKCKNGKKTAHRFQEQVHHLVSVQEKSYANLEMKWNRRLPAAVECDSH